MPDDEDDDLESYVIDTGEGDDSEEHGSEKAEDVEESRHPEDNESRDEDGGDGSQEKQTSDTGDKEVEEKGTSSSETYDVEGSSQTGAHDSGGIEESGVTGTEDRSEGQVREEKMDRDEGAVDEGVNKQVAEGDAGDDGGSSIDEDDDEEGAIDEVDEEVDTDAGDDVMSKGGAGYEESVERSEEEGDDEEVTGNGAGGNDSFGIKALSSIDRDVEDTQEVDDFFGGRDVRGDVESDFDTVDDFFERGEVDDDSLSEDSIDSLLSEAKKGIAEFEGKEGFIEYERYWVNKPYSYVAILYSDAENDYMYYVVEPELDDFEQSVRSEVEERLRDVLMYEDMEGETSKEVVLEKKARGIIDGYGLDIEDDTFNKVLYYLKRDYVHDGKIDPIMRDPAIEDVSCDGDNVPVFVYHSDYRDLMTNIEYKKDELDSYVIKLAQKSGKHISVAKPLVDASTPDGSRVQMTLGREVTDRGSTFTIRKFNDIPLTPIDLIQYNTFSLEQMAYLWMCIENNKSLIFAGGTASGKTTSMNSVSLFIPPKSKVISIEDTREVTLPHMNWIPSVTRDSFGSEDVGNIDEYELLRAALRQRPEYLVVGEVRGEEALTLFQAMSTGHTTYSTMHADSVDSAIHRLENPPISVPRSMLKALDIVSVQAQTFVKGERVRRNQKLVEIIGIDPKTRNIRTDDVFEWDAETDSFIRTGDSDALEEIRKSRGWNQQELERQLNMRREVLEYLLENGITGYRDVSKTIHSFIIDPDRIMNRIKQDGLKLDQLDAPESTNV
ncbi:MAG: ATPase, T2SS/T4P/T4SS family [Halobacteria archaeon]